MTNNTGLFKRATYRRSNGRFATPEQHMHDKMKQRNEFLEYENEMLRRKLDVFQKKVLNREIRI
jgi:hypothetical protein